MSSKEPTMAIGERIKKLRGKMTRRELSSLTGADGVTEQTIFQIENYGREPELRTLRLLAEALHTSVGNLMGEKT